MADVDQHPADYVQDPRVIDPLVITYVQPFTDYWLDLLVGSRILRITDVATGEYMLIADCSVYPIEGRVDECVYKLSDRSVRVFSKHEFVSFRFSPGQFQAVLDHAKFHPGGCIRFGVDTDNKPYYVLIQRYALSTRGIRAAQQMAVNNYSELENTGMMRV